MDISRIKILTVDRPRMTYDVTSIFVKHQINIIWMEVYTYVIYVKFEKQPETIWRQMRSELIGIPGIKNVETVDFIVLEEKELEVRTVLNSISQGIVIVDRDGRVKYLNQYAAAHIFRLHKDAIIGRPLKDCDKSQVTCRLIESWDDENESHRAEITIRNKSYLVSVSPILSDDERLSSHMLTFEDMHRIGEIFNLQRFDNPITFNDIYGDSDAMKEVINQALAYSQSDSPALILGESGTGKELFARAMHNASPRSARPFVALNCAAIPDQLLESELFGYEEGAFTGGKKSGKTGLLEVANGGTVFLDEIGEMPPHLQAKLLRVLQEHKLRKLGSNREIPINIRILTATNRNINGMVAAGQFRLDLYYRINVFTLIIPPLRERVEDIQVLARIFAKEYAQKYGKETMKIHPEVLHRFGEYEWPGNVRELQNVLERAIAVADSGTIRPEHIQFSEVPKKQRITAGKPLKETLASLEKEMIREALGRHRSIREAARTLGVTHTLLLNRMKKYRLEQT